jgi:hypothetical protein
MEDSMNHRLRTRLGTALVLICLFTGAVAAQETYLGLLGEIAGPSFLPFVSGLQFQKITLYETPHEPLAAAPQGDDIQYGFIKLGNDADSRISLAVRLGPEPLLWIDANNNEDLYDDGAVAPDALSPWRRCVWNREVVVSYWKDGIHSSASYPLQVMGWWSDGAWEFYYAGCVARKGLVQINAAFHTMWLWDIDSDGLFNDVEDLGVGIDNNGDGELSVDFSSPECFLGEAPFLPAGVIQIGKALYELVDVSPDGRSVVLSASTTDVKPLPILEPGFSAPVFKTQTVRGAQLDLAEDRSQPLLLLFAPMFQLYPERIDYCSSSEWSEYDDCFFGFGQPKSTGSQRALDRTRELIDAATRSTNELGFRIVLLATDPMLLGPDTPTTLDQLDLPMPIVWDETVLELYRTFVYGALVIDTDGVIVARDTWVYHYDASGRLASADLDPLSFWTISGIMESLIVGEP